MMMSVLVVVVNAIFRVYCSKRIEFLRGVLPKAENLRFFPVGRNRTDIVSVVLETCRIELRREKWRLEKRRRSEFADERSLPGEAATGAHKEGQAGKGIG